MNSEGLPIKSKEEALRFRTQLTDFGQGWVYRVIEPDGRVITVEKYFESQDFKDRYQKYLDAQPEKETEVEPPLYVGTLTKPFGIKGYTKAEVGHSVFEVGGKYIITIYDEKTNNPHVVSFYKETLQPHIKFNNEN